MAQSLEREIREGGFTVRRNLLVSLLLVAGSVITVVDARPALATTCPGEQNLFTMQGNSAHAYGGGGTINIKGNDILDAVGAE